MAPWKFGNKQKKEVDEEEENVEYVEEEVEVDSNGEEVEYVEEEVEVTDDEEEEEAKVSTVSHTSVASGKSNRVKEVSSLKLAYHLVRKPVGRRKWKYFAPSGKYCFLVYFSDRVKGSGRRGQDKGQRNC